MYSLKDFIGKQGMPEKIGAGFINKCIAVLSFFSGGYRQTLVIDRQVQVLNPIRLRSNVMLAFDGGGFVSDIPKGLPLVYTDTGEVVYNCGLRDMEADVNVSDLLWLSSAAECDFSFNRISTNSKTNIMLRLHADATQGTTPDGHGRNIVSNVFTGLKTRGECGTVVRLAGMNSNVVTLNTFRDFNCPMVADVGYNFRAWCDNNLLDGLHRLNLTSTDARGLVMNSKSPDNIMGVYSNSFQHLAVDAYEHHIENRRGRVLVEINNSRDTRGYIFGDRWDSEDGSTPIKIHPKCRSYDIKHGDGRSGFNVYYQEGI